MIMEQYGKAKLCLLLMPGGNKFEDDKDDDNDGDDADRK